MRIGMREARNTFNQLVRRTQAGERFVILRRGKPIAKLERIGPVKPANPPELVQQIFRASDKLEKELRAMFKQEPEEPDVR